MDFNIWYYEQQTDIGYREMKKAFEAGQQSKQAEIDALREMVKKLIDNTVLSIDDELEDKANNLLKGK